MGSEAQERSRKSTKNRIKLLIVQKYRILPKWAGIRLFDVKAFFVSFVG